MNPDRSGKRVASRAGSLATLESMAALARRSNWRTRGSRFTLAVAGLLAIAGVLLCGCGATSRTLSTTAKAAASTNPAAPSTMGQMSGGSGSRSGSGGSAKPADGVTPIPTQTLGTADWQHMKIMAQARTAVPFVVDDGTSEKLVKPSKRTSFHLMVMLTRRPHQLHDPVCLGVGDDPARIEDRLR